MVIRHAFGKQVPHCTRSASIPAMATEPVVGGQVTGIKSTQMPVMETQPVRCGPMAVIPSNPTRVATPRQFNNVPVGRLEVTISFKNDPVREVLLAETLEHLQLLLDSIPVRTLEVVKALEEMQLKVLRLETDLALAH